MSFPPSKTVLVTGGRAPVALELARLFHEAGHRVLVAESLEHHLCAHSRFVAKRFRVPAPNQAPEAFATALAAIARDEKVDLLIPTCEEVFWVSRGLPVISPHCRVLTSPLALMRTLHSKWDFIQQLNALGFSTPATWRLESAADLERLREETDLKLVLKPVFSRFATQVRFLAPGQPTPPLDIRPDHPWVAQAYIEGQQLCTYGVAVDGKLLAHAAYGAEFTAGQGASLHFAFWDHPGVQAWITRLVAALNYTGQISFDFILDAEGRLFPLECNPRATSGVHLFTPEDRLDQAFFGERETTLLPRTESQAMLGLAMVVYGLPAARSPERLIAWAKTVAASRDVIFRLDDPAPFFDQFRAFGDFLVKSRTHGITALEASTLDIEWNGHA